MLKINYKKFMKHAEKVAKAKHLTARPVLQGIHHDDKGTLTVTDSHRLLQVRNVNAPKNAVLHAVTGEPIDGNYPNVSRLIPNLGDEKAAMELSGLKALIKLFKAYQTAATYSGAKKDDVGIRAKDSQLKMDILRQGSSDYQLGGAAMTYQADSISVEGEIQASFNAGYFIEALEFMEDLGADSVEIHFHGNNRPFIVYPKIGGKLEEDALALILPVREY